MMRALWLLLALCSLLAPALADDARPAYLEIREVGPGLYEVSWKTPMLGAARLRMTPRFVAEARTVPGSYRSQQLSDALIESWRVQIDGGISDTPIRIDGLTGSLRDVIVRIRFADGRRANAVLRGTRAVFVAPAPPEDPLMALPTRIRAGALAGLTHALRSPLHLLLAFASAWFGCGLLLGRGLAAFLVAALCGVVAVRFTGLQIPAPVGELAVGVAAILAARMAWRSDPRGLVRVLGVAGLVHGMALGSVADGAWSAAATALGTDLAHLGAGGVTLLLRARLLSAPVRSLGAYACGVAAVACTGIATTWPEPIAEAPQTIASLPILGDESKPAAAVPARGLEDDLALFVDVAAFETRVELLARLRPLAERLGHDLDGQELIPAADQRELIDALGAALADRLLLSIDGAQVAELEALSSGFTSIDDTGIYLRDQPVDERSSEAVVGFVFALPTPGLPEQLQVGWPGLPAGLEPIPLRWTDPESTLDVSLSAAVATVSWENRLGEDPIPTVEAVRMRVPALPLSIPACLLGLGSLLALLVATLRRGGAPCSRVLLTLGCLLAPLGTVDVELPVLRSAVPSPQQASAISAALLRNVYRAFEHRAEQSVYDCLAVSVAQEPLESIYLEQRRGLQVERAGGARARVEVVEVTGLEDLHGDGEGGFEAALEWTVAGSVTHFGHRHVRHNRYRARVSIRPSAAAWKIHALELLDEERLR